jgi:hypothetical protein
MTRFTICTFVFLCLTYLYTSTTYTNPLFIKVATDVAIVVTSGAALAGMYIAKDMVLYGKEEVLQNLEYKVKLVKIIIRTLGSAIDFHPCDQGRIAYLSELAKQQAQ